MQVPRIWVHPSQDLVPFFRGRNAEQVDFPRELINDADSRDLCDHSEVIIARLFIL